MTGKIDYRLTGAAVDHGHRVYRIILRRRRNPSPVECRSDDQRVSVRERLAVMVEGEAVRAVLITGTIGSGKTALAAEMGEALAAKGVAAAIIDLDWLGWFQPASDSETTIDSLIVKNLQAVWPNYRSAGAGHFVLTRAIQDAAVVGELRRALPEADMTVVRVTASPDTIAKRLRGRDTGSVLAEHLVETTRMERILDEIQVEDFCIANEGRSIRETARDLLRRLEWI